MEFNRILKCYILNDLDDDCLIDYENVSNGEIDACNNRLLDGILTGLSDNKNHEIFNTPKKRKIGWFIGLFSSIQETQMLSDEIEAFRYSLKVL